MKTKIIGQGIAALGDAFTLKKEALGKVLAISFSKIKSYLLHAATASLKFSLLIALAIMALIFTNRAHAQQHEDFLLKKNQFSVEIGANYIKMVDFQYSPNMFQSLRKNVQLGYTNRLRKGIFSTHLNVYMGNLTPTSGLSMDYYGKDTDINGVETVDSISLKLSQMGFDLEIGYLHELKELATSRTALYLGGSLEESFNYAPGFISIGTIHYGALNAKARFDYLLRNGKPLMFGLSVPLVSLVTRMPYHNSPNYPGKSGIAGFFTDNNHVETLNHFQNIRFSVKYHWLVSKKFAFDIAYQGSWLHYYRPEHLSQAGSQLSLGFTF